MAREGVEQAQLVETGRVEAEQSHNFSAAVMTVIPPHVPARLKFTHELVNLDFVNGESRSASDYLPPSLAKVLQLNPVRHSEGSLLFRSTYRIIIAKCSKSRDDSLLRSRCFRGS